MASGIRRSLRVCRAPPPVAILLPAPLLSRDGSTGVSLPPPVPFAKGRKGAVLPENFFRFQRSLVSSPEPERPPVCGFGVSEWPPVSVCVNLRRKGTRGKYRYISMC